MPSQSPHFATSVIKTLFLEKFALECQEAREDLGCLDGAKVDLETACQMRRMAQTLVARARFYIAGMGDKETRYPADWWQALKDRFAPTWFKRRYPVVQNIVKTYKVCPHLNTSAERKHLEFFLCDKLSFEDERGLLEEKMDRVRKYGIRSKQDADIAMTMKPWEVGPRYPLSVGGPSTWEV